MLQCQQLLTKILHAEMGKLKRKLEEKIKI